MKIRRIIPGNRVQKKGKGQIMIVQKYCLKNNVLFGNYLSDTDVKCIWYENGKRKSGIFDVRTLTKVSNHKQNNIFQNNQDSQYQQINI